MCYIADLYAEGGRNGVCGELQICRDKKGQSISASYGKKDGSFLGGIYISNNYLYHAASEDETCICIFRNHKIINPVYRMNNENERCCRRRLRCGDVIVLLTKENNSLLYGKYLSKLFSVNNKRRNRNKDYLSFEKIFEKECCGKVFVMIFCIGN